MKQVDKKNTYSQDDVIFLIWESRKLFQSEKYLNLSVKNRKNKVKKWFNEYIKNI